eukprot:813734_1
MTLSEEEAVIIGCIVGSFIVIIFGLLLWYFCAESCTTHQIEPDYSKLHTDHDTSTKLKHDQTDTVDKDAPLTIVHECHCICGGDLTLTEVHKCYDDCKDKNCYICKAEVTGLSKVYHCSVSSQEHPEGAEGLDVCVACMFDDPEAKSNKCDDLFDNDTYQALCNLQDEHVVEQFFALFDENGDGEITGHEVSNTLKNLDRDLNISEIILASRMVDHQRENRVITLRDLKNRVPKMPTLPQKALTSFYSTHLEFRKIIHVFTTATRIMEKSVNRWPVMKLWITNDPDNWFEPQFSNAPNEFHYVVLITFRLPSSKPYWDGTSIRCDVNVDNTVHHGRAVCQSVNADNSAVCQESETKDLFLVGMHRILCVHDKLPKIIRLTVGNDDEQTITINYEQINTWTEEETLCTDIKGSRSYKTDIYDIYEEQIHIQPACALDSLCEQQCGVYSDPGKGMEDYVKVFAEKLDMSDMTNIMKSVALPAWIPKQMYGYMIPSVLGAHDFRQCQFYYCKATKTAYRIHNETVEKSNVYSQKSAIIQEYNFYDFKSGFYEVNPKQIVLYQNITPPIRIARRYNFIKEYCLYGQDNEFNIFRSICFIKPGPHSDWEKMRRFAIGVVCLMLQICLTIGIVTEVIENWEMLDNEYRDDIIIAISIFSFSFVSFTYLFTVRKFLQFYIAMEEVCDVSWIIILFDFISNVVIGFIICASSLCFLLQSETVIDTVLNSFALIFVIELDDFINLFESDESVLIANDWSHYKRNVDWDFKQGKRKVNVIPKKCSEWMWLVICVVISPLYWI